MNLPYAINMPTKKKWLVWYIKHASPSESQRARKKAIECACACKYAHIEDDDDNDEIIWFGLIPNILNLRINCKV